MEEIIITYKDKTFIKDIKDQIRQMGGTVKEVIELANIITALIPIDKKELIKQVPGVTFVGKDEPMVELESGYSWYIDLMKVLEFHKLENKGEGIKIATIDTGIDYTHPALKDNYKGGYNVITKLNDGMDLGAHGTAVAGLAAAKDLGDGVVGIAPNADLYGVCVLKPPSTFSVLQTTRGISWAIENNMDIINISLGGPSWACMYFNTILQKAKDKGIVVVAAAGSDGVQGVITPAKCDNSIAVAAIRSELYDFETIYSNYGPEVDVSAPGSYVYTTKKGGGYKHMSGTSAASPIIAGVMALLKKKYPTKSVDELATVMYSLCKDIGVPGKDIHTGHGVPLLSAQQGVTFPISINSTPPNADITVG